ncbi:unnamed protein product [Effrenium voratum]|nr:unnamed protein product [Effrenium voratum]
MSPKKNDKKTITKKTDESSGSGGYAVAPDNRPGSSTDPIFNPFAPVKEVNTEELTAAFSNLTLEEQLVVAKSYESAFEEMKKRKSSIKSVKQVANKIQSQKNKDDQVVEQKPTSERYKKTPLTLNVRTSTGETFTLTAYRSDRYGTLRQLIVRQLGLKKDTKLNMLLNEANLPEATNSTTFLYTLNFQNEDNVFVTTVVDSANADSEGDSETGDSISQDVDVDLQ